jgi:hypothetical protein
LEDFVNGKLLQRIKKHILEDPKRLDMGMFLARKEQHPGAYKYPACGTVGCIAGWACVLSKENLTRSDEIEQRAAELLGLTPIQAARLFYSGSGMGHKAQSRKMARSVAKIIDTFIATEGADAD